MMALRGTLRQHAFARIRQSAKIPANWCVKFCQSFHLLGCNSGTTSLIRMHFLQGPDDELELSGTRSSKRKTSYIQQQGDGDGDRRKHVRRFGEQLRTRHAGHMMNQATQDAMKVTAWATTQSSRRRRRPRLCALFAHAQIRILRITMGAHAKEMMRMMMISPKRLTFWYGSCRILL